MVLGNRACKCGAIDRCTEATIEARQIDSFECVICRVTLESCNSLMADLPQIAKMTEPNVEVPAELRELAEKTINQVEGLLACSLMRRADRLPRSPR